MSLPGATVALLAQEPDLGAGLDAHEIVAARQVAHVPVLTLSPGELRDPSAGGGHPLLLLDGYVVREIVIGDRAAWQLLGPGDVLDPARPSLNELGVRAGWRVLQPVTAALLGERFGAICARWPVIGVAMQLKLGEQADRAALTAAVVALPRVEQRVLAFLWLVAGRWGRMTADGAVVPLALTHLALGRMVGAQRSTVTLALGQLGEQGVVHRDDAGHLRLAAGSDALVGVVRGSRDDRPAVTRAASHTRPRGAQAGLGAFEDPAVLAGRFAAYEARVDGVLAHAHHTVEEVERVRTKVRARRDAVPPEAP